jgi:hypothetical protein
MITLTDHELAIVRLSNEKLYNSAKELELIVDNINNGGSILPNNTVVKYEFHGIVKANFKVPDSLMPVFECHSPIGNLGVVFSTSIVNQFSSYYVLKICTKNGYYYGKEFYIFDEFKKFLELDYPFGPETYITDMWRM